MDHMMASLDKYRDCRQYAQACACRNSYAQTCGVVTKLVTLHESCHGINVIYMITICDTQNMLTYASDHCSVHHTATWTLHLHNVLHLDFPSSVTLIRVRLLQYSG